ncbi:MAG: hypothetical protein CL678_08225 [Bdellovibrionaceae bacterium]|nr:hypothetical protein [Pseudobdellovibrionaceae bacterium]
MLSSVLNSKRAIEVNIQIVRAFVVLREVLKSDSSLENKIKALERKYNGQFKMVFEAIHEIMSTHSVPRKRIIGLGDENV